MKKANIIFLTVSILVFFACQAKSRLYGQVFSVFEKSAEVWHAKTDPDNNFSGVDQIFISKINNELSCNDDVIIALDNNCEAVVTADMVLEGNNIRNEDLTVVIDHGEGEKIRDKIIRHGDFKYEVYDKEGRFICEGIITAEDKTAPAYSQRNPVEVFVTCTTLDTILKYSDSDLERNTQNCLFEGITWDILEEQNSFFINEIKDNCTAFCHLEFEVNDVFMPADVCTSGSMIIRTIKVSDEHGNASEFIIRFISSQLVLSKEELKREVTIDLCTNPEAEASNFFDDAGTFIWYENIKIGGALLKEKLDDRFFQGGNTASLCGYAISYEDEELPIECDGKKIIRKWTVLNWCKEGESRIEEKFEQTIKVGFFEAPSVACNDMLPAIVSAGTFDCTATFLVPHPIVSNCKGSFDYTIKIFEFVPELDKFGIPTGNTARRLAVVPTIRQPGGQYLIAGLPIGNYEIEYNVSTECGTASAPLRCPFSVADLTEPVAVCDDELNISLGGEGISRITARDVDEGSWDNCELESIKIRRSLDSCLDEYLNEVIGLSSLNDLIRQELPDFQRVWYRFEGTKRVNLIRLERVKDGSLRYFTEWDDEVYFLCCDISKSMNDFVTVELQATDKALNTNKCWMDIFIENKLTPRCTAPAPVEFNCWDFTIDGSDIAQVRAEFGTVDELLASKDLTVDFNCDFVVTDEIRFDPRDCSEGTLRRVFTVTAPSTQGIMSSTCTQVITINKVNDYLITFPGDDEDVCAGDGGVGIETESYTCDILAINTDTTVFTASGDECFKRYVTYRVINWCEYDGVSLEPTVVPRDVDCDGNFAEPTYVKSFEGDVWIDDDASIARKGAIPSDDEFVISFTADQESYTSLSCDNKEYWYTPGYWEYTQVIKVYDDVPPVFEFDTLAFCAFGATGAAPCNGEVMIPFTVEDICTELVEVRDVRLAVNGVNPTNFRGDLYELEEIAPGSYQISSIPGVGLPVGSHFFLVKAADNCGNIVVRELPFTIEDCKTPSPVCLQAVTIDLMPVVENGKVVSGANTVQVTDLIASDIFDCTPHPDADLGGDVKYYAIKGDTPLSIEAIVLESNRMVEFNCEDGSTVPVFVYAVDGAGNFDYCTVFVTLEPGADPAPCIEGPASAEIQGVILTERHEPVEDVVVSLSGPLNARVKTNIDGFYSFSELTSGYDYSIRPYLDTDPLNGVSTFDIVLMTRHILGIDQLKSPYKLIAADINRSGTVTALDIIELRKLILNIDKTFSHNTNWRFIDAAYQFPDRDYSIGISPKELISINNMEEGLFFADFTAIKTGDINTDAITNSSKGVIRKVDGLFRLRASNTDFSAEDRVVLNISAKDLEKLSGLQFTLSFNTERLELEDIELGLCKAENISTAAIEDGLITVSWNWPVEKSWVPSEKESFLKLIFRAHDDGKLKETVRIGSRITPAEAYTVEGIQKDILLSFGDSEPLPGFELQQNHPNPFTSQTTIGMIIPEEAPVVFKIFDVNGRLVKAFERNLHKGYNEVIIDADGLPVGLLYYIVTTGNFTAKRKMIFIRQ